MKVTCKICKTKKEKEDMFIIPKGSIVNGKEIKVNMYFCSKEEYVEDKRVKDLKETMRRMITSSLNITRLTKTDMIMLSKIILIDEVDVVYDTLTDVIDNTARLVQENCIIANQGKLDYMYAVINNSIHIGLECKKHKVRMSSFSISEMEKPNDCTRVEKSNKDYTSLLNKIGGLY